MNKNYFLCFVHDCPKNNECERYRPREDEILCLTYTSKHYRITDNDFSCFLQKISEVEECR